MNFSVSRSTLILAFILFINAAAWTPCPAEEEAGRDKPAPVRKTVVIDPGHGGADNGATGPGRSREKDLTLSFARLLESRLSKKYKIIMTRKSDSAVEARNRTEAANKAQGDLLISVHAGGSFNPDTGGIALYFHEPEAASLQRTEEESPQAFTAMVRWDSVQDRYRSLSRTLALIMNENLSVIPVENDRLTVSVSSLPDRVLAGADMPALHMEIGQLTNASDEKRLKKKDFLARMADAVLKSVDTFFDQYPEKSVREF